MQIERLVFSLIITVLLGSGGCATLPEKYRSLDSGKELRLEEVLPLVGEGKVIFVGEGHDSVEDHLVQYEVIKYLHDTGKKVAVALEMFEAERQPLLDRWSDGALSEDEFERTYSASWEVPYGNYGAIFEYTRREGLPLFGINGDPQSIGAVAKRGLASLPEGYRKKIGAMSCDDLPEYKKMMEPFKPRTTHVRDFLFFCDAQLLRDTVMAYNIAGILARDDYTVVAMVGSVHAMKWAVPAMLSRYTKGEIKVLVSKAFTDLLFRKPSLQIADYVWY